MKVRQISDPSHWRDLATRMRALAGDRLTGEAREAALRMAADYELFAERAEQRTSGHPNYAEASLVPEPEQPAELVK